MNGALHIAAAVTIGYYTEWNYGVSCLLYTRVVFDTVLNIFRHKGVGYVSPSPMSVLDKIEKRIIMWVAGLVHKKRTFIPDGKIQWVAICFRIVILGLATWALFW